MAKKTKQPEADPRLKKYEELAAANSGMYALINEKGELLTENTYELIRTPSEGLIAFKNEGKNGFLRLDGTVAVPAMYESVADFKDGLAAVKKDGRWGFIDVDGKVVIPIEFENLSSPYFRDGLAIIMKDGKYGYIDKTGSIVIKPEFEWAYPFEGDLAAVRKDGFTGCINKKGEMVIQPLYSLKPGTTSMWHGNFAKVSVKNKYGLIDRKGNVVLPFEYDEVDFYPSESTLLMQEGDEKYYKFSVKPGGTGMIGSTRVVIDPIYKEIGVFSDGLAPAVKDGKAGYIDAEGNTVLPFEYDSASQFKGNCDNYARVTKDKRTFIIDRTGAQICDKLESLEFSGKPIAGYTGAMKDGKYGVLDNEGHFVVACEFDSIKRWGETSLILVEKDDKYGIHDLAGHEIVKPEFQSIDDPRDPVAPVNLTSVWDEKEGALSVNGEIIVNPADFKSCGVEDKAPVIIVRNHDDKMGLRRYDGSEITECIFDRINSFSADGMAVAALDGKYGLIDTNGQWVIPAEHENLEDMSEGLAAAQKEGKWGFVNTDNEWVIKPTYDRVHSGFSNGYAIVMNGGKDILINQTGKELTKPAGTLRIWEPVDGMIRFLVGRKFGYLDLKGTIAIKPTFDEADDFDKGIALASIKVDKEPMWTFVKKDGTIGEPFQNRVFNLGTLIPVDKGSRKAIYLPDGTLAIPFVLKQTSRVVEGVAAIQFA